MSEHEQKEGFETTEVDMNKEAGSKAKTMEKTWNLRWHFKFPIKVSSVPAGHCKSHSGLPCIKAPLYRWCAAVFQISLFGCCHKWLWNWNAVNPVKYFLPTFWHRCQSSSHFYYLTEKISAVLPFYFRKPFQSGGGWRELGLAFHASYINSASLIIFL